MTLAAKVDDRLLDYLNELLSDGGQEPAERAPAPPVSDLRRPATPFVVSSKAEALAPKNSSKVDSMSSRPEPAPLVQPHAAVSRAELDTPAQIQHQLEEEKRAQLQRLLMPRSPKIETPDPLPDTDIASPLPEVVPALAPELAPAAEEQEQQQLDDFPESLKPLLDWDKNGRPLWAQGKFDALLFDVGGLTLAVPLITLGQIFPLGEELTPIFGQSKWMMGILPTTSGRLKIVNTALFVMPEKYDERFVDTAKYVVSIDGLSWALAVDRVNQPISLDPADIRWRGERSKRSWLAGTVKTHMCALIDVPRMGRLLAEADIRRPQKNSLA